WYGNSQAAKRHSLSPKSSRALDLYIVHLVFAELIACGIRVTPTDSRSTVPTSSPSEIPLPEQVSQPRPSLDEIARIFRFGGSDVFAPRSRGRTPSAPNSYTND